MNAPLSPTDFYHTGIVVPDLDEAAAHLTAVAGYHWTKPMEYIVPVVTADGGYEVPFRMSYSVQAPHLELVQAVPGTPWTAVPGRATHHLGYWTDDIATASLQLEQAGFAREVAPCADQHQSFAYHVDATSTRIEIVDRALFPDWPGFLQSMAQ
ncbi:VOC family protein [Mycobacterium hubeiense]|uniref:VOC family protein n=1 Tax=Mycobacterium hubeiense TaxID=1867256 RepID=UPI000C7EE0B5|nr:VOC family protein [Mycobacterium sp. QGD 101]